MTIICSWCRGEGKHGLVGEKAPLEDRRETHGICMTHRIAVQTRWLEIGRGSGLSGSALMTVGAANDVSEIQASSYMAMSAGYLWAGLRNLTRKSRS